MTRGLTADAVETNGIAAEARAVAAWLGEQVIGKDRVVEHLLIALLSDGHVLLEGAPGLAKTRLARLMSQTIEGVFRRIQFTPDLLPADLIGGSIYNARENRFEFHRGPVFANFLLADEINRAPAKVQSALLEAMEERQVTAGDATYALEQPFFVVATQNPIEHDGTWDLPQAQLDRFLMQIVIDYPGEDDEQEILTLALSEVVGATVGRAPPTPPSTLTRDGLLAARAEIAKVHLAPMLQRYVVRLVAATREGGPEAVTAHLSHPISPRGTIMLARAAQARAWLRDRDHALPEDVAALAPDVLRHRLGLSFRAEADGVSSEAVIRSLLEMVDVV